MKKDYLLFTIIILFAITANAQLKRSEATHAPARPQLQLMKPEVKEEVMQMRNPGTPVFKAPQKAVNFDCWYRRPAGAFPAGLVVEDGTYSGLLYAPYFAVTPYVDYTFNGFVDGAGPDANIYWKYQLWVPNEDGTDSEQMWLYAEGQDITIQYGYETDSVPVFYVKNGAVLKQFTYTGYSMSGTSENPVADAQYISDILSVPSTMEIWETDFLKSSKNFCYGGRNGDQRYPMTYYYSGAQPYGQNEDGFWFGKNAGTSGGNPVDGIAQAFEKPTAPYLLKQVVLDCAVLEVAAQVDMTCRIYKLDEVPAYNDTTYVALPDEPGELIAMGRATVTPETDATTGGLIFFTLYDESGSSEQVITPTIDSAILVVVDGYNDPEMENLTNFSAMISSDMDVDEGFGELAYLKFGIPNEDGNLDHYVWAGLNNFFTSGQMKTGLTIFLSTENPYLSFKHTAEDGEYTFPVEGGVMEKQFGSHTSRSIEFRSWIPSANDEWFLSCNDEEVPEWLNIELEDQMQGGEFTGFVYAVVTAEPLPEGLSGREAIVRFHIPGNYIDYKFIQGEFDPDEPFYESYDFVINGIYYKITGENEVCVTFKDKRYSTYSGDIVIPSDVVFDNTLYRITSIGKYAFRSCNNLTSLTLPVSLMSIADNAFKDCSVKNICITGQGAWNNLALPESTKNIFIGSEVTSIEGLYINPTTIYCYATTPPTCDENTFREYNGSLHIPASSLASYFIADYWCNFINISGDAIEPFALSINPDSIHLQQGGQKTLVATLTPANATPNAISWHSSNKDVATVVNGQVTAVANGECEIFATCAGIQNRCHVTVSEILPTAINLSQETATLEVGTQLALTATVLPDSTTNQNIIWLSTAEDIATVNNGVITALSPGECDIIARCHNIEAVCHLTVINRIIYITLDQHNIRVRPNHLALLTPTVTPEPTDLKVTSSDPTVAAARLAGDAIQVVGIKEGTTTITVGSTDGTAVSDTCLVTVFTNIGDVNCDGFIDINDVTTLINHLLTGDTSNIKVANADCYHDGEIDINDITTLINYLLTGEPMNIDDMTQITFVAGIDNGTSDGSAHEYTIVKDGITIVVSNGLANSGQYCIYKGQTATITSADGPITKVVFECTAEGTNQYGPGCLTSYPEKYSYEGNIGTWQGTSQSVVFTAATNQVRATKITVTVNNTGLVSPCYMTNYIYNMNNEIPPIQIKQIETQTTH